MESINSPLSDQRRVSELNVLCHLSIFLFFQIILYIYCSTIEVNSLNMLVYNIIVKSKC